MTIPYLYQLKDVRTIHKLGGRVLLALDMGLGKSFESIFYAERHREIKKIIVICPAGLKWNWEQEIKQHSGEQDLILGGKQPKAMYFPKYIILNYEILEAW